MIQKTLIRRRQMNVRPRLIATLAACLFLFVLPFRGQEDEDKVLRLAIGEARLKNQTLKITTGEIASARSGRALPFARMIKEMAGRRFVYVGESHDNMTMHDIQLRVIQALHERDRNIAVGLEMLPVETQPVLDKWSRGVLSDDEFVREVRWYVYWNMNFGYYQKIFDFAKENGIPVFALNVPREIITKIRLKGWESLSEQEKEMVPRPDLSSADHRILIRTMFEETELPHEMKGEGFEKTFEGLYRAQVAWDEVMAANAIKGEEKSKSRMIVLAGSGHLLYNLGVNARVYEQNRLPFATLVPVSVAPGEKQLLVERSLADFVWGIPEQERPAFPSVGLALTKVEGLENLVIERNPIDGVALGQDFQKGDVVLSVDGKSFSDINELRIYLARFTWGEESMFRLLRDGEVKESLLRFRWEPEPNEEAKTAESQAPMMRGGMKAPAGGPSLDRLRKQVEALVREGEGTVGVAVRHIESGRGFELNGSTSFPMASVFKVPVLVEVLAQVGEGKFSLDDEVSIQRTDQHLGSGLISSLAAPGLKLSLRNLVNLMMLISDNSATDILVEKVGPENVTRRLREFGVEGISVNRTCQELIMDYAGLDYAKYKGLSLDQFAAEFRSATNRSPEAYREAVERFSLDPRDQSTPLAMNSLLEKIFKSEILDRDRCDFVLSLMLKCQTGEARIKGDLPPGTGVAHKTGTIAGTVNDVGVIYLPEGLGHVALTIFTKNFAGDTGSVEKIIARIARFVYDFFYFTS
jgi:beta-lactamase class A